MTASALKQFAANPPKPEENKETVNHYKHLEGKQLPQEIALALTTNNHQGVFCFAQMIYPSLVLLQPGPSTKQEGEKLKAEQKKIAEEQSNEPCWMNTEGLPGCTGEILAWDKLKTVEKEAMADCNIYTFSLKPPEQQQAVIADRELRNIIFLTYQRSSDKVKEAENLAAAAKLFSTEFKSLKGTPYPLRGALLVAPGGIVVKSYDLDTKDPSKNPANIFKTLAEDRRMAKQLMQQPKKEKTPAILPDVNAASVQNRSHA